ncbi:YdcF family protein [Paracoccaceae bacterium Fryx2]|nr:YdcF family protein [Paracoccaceae bacterium Fryx2]
MIQDRPDASGGVVIVLGAAVWAGGVASPTLRRRAEHGARCFRDRGATLLITTGGTGRHPPAEAEVAAAICIAAGVPPGAVLRELRSASTLENLGFALAMLPKGPVGPVTIVTDGYHVPRALLTARMLGVAARASAPGRADGPRLGPRQRLRMVLREAFALPAYAVRLVLARWRG